MYMPRQFRPFVRLSVTRMYCIKTAECIIRILSLSDRPIILVIRHKVCCINLTASPLTGMPNTNKVAIFDEYVVISRKR